jgi:hypothetical protein
MFRPAKRSRAKPTDVLNNLMNHLTEVQNEIWIFFYNKMFQKFSLPRYLTSLIEGQKKSQVSN